MNLLNRRGDAGQCRLGIKCVLDPAQHKSSDSTGCIRGSGILAKLQSAKISTHHISRGALVDSLDNIRMIPRDREGQEAQLIRLV